MPDIAYDLSPGFALSDHPVCGSRLQPKMDSCKLSTLPTALSLALNSMFKEKRVSLELIYFLSL